MKINGLPKDFFVPLIDRAVKMLNPKKIILFGSFARGDYKKKSDIDLAFDIPPSKNWVLFKQWVEDEFQTLKPVDLIDLSKAEESLIKSVQKEGMILYERKD